MKASFFLKSSLAQDHTSALARILTNTNFLVGDGSLNYMRYFERRRKSTVDAKNVYGADIAEDAK